MWMNWTLEVMTYLAVNGNTRWRKWLNSLPFKSSSGERKSTGFRLYGEEVLLPDVLLMTYGDSECISCSLYPGDSLSFSVLSVWHCASVCLALCLGSWLLQAQACLPSGLGRAGTNSRQGSWREQSRYFSYPVLQGPAFWYWQSFFFQGPNVLWVLVPCSLRPGVGKSFSVSLVSGYFITPHPTILP